MLINGSLDSSIPALDRGLQYGDGLFETDWDLACTGGGWWKKYNPKSVPPALVNAVMKYGFRFG